MSTDTEVGLSANAQAFTREMERAAQAAMTTGQRIQSAFRDAGANAASSMMGALDRINDKAKGAISVMEHYRGAIAAIGAMAGALAGVAMGAKQLADKTYEATHGAELLGSKLGVSAAQAGVLSQALDNIESDTGTLEAGLTKITKALGGNEAAFHALGVATRDGNGNLRNSLDILQDTNARLAEFREGTDRNIEMQKIYSKGWQDMVPLLHLTAEAMAETEATAQSLGLVLGEENVAAAHAYDDAMDQVDMVLSGLRKAIGDVLMPVLAKLGEWFASLGPAAITVTRGAVGGLAAAFWGFKNGVVAVFEIINAAVITVAEPILTVSRAMYRLMQGDFKGAVMEFDRGGKTMAAAWKNAFAEIAASSRETGQKLWNLFATPTPLADKSGAGLTAKKDKKAAGPKGRQVSDAEWAMEESAHLNKTLYEVGEQRAAAEEAAFERASIAAEAWEADLERANRAVAEAARKAAEQRMQVEYLWAQNAAAARLAVVDQAQAQARHEVDLGLKTKEELLAQEMQFELDRNAIRLQALQERLVQIDPEKDPVAYAQTMVAIEELERQHQERMGEIRREAAIEQAAPALNAITGIEQTMAGSMQKLMMLQTSFAGFMRSLWQGVMSAITGEIAKWLAQWIMAKIKAMIFGKVAALGEVARHAGVAGAGGVASMAAAPFPLNLTAPAFGAAMAAAAMAFAPAAAAAGGYDIPAGINPVTQLHQREMVLPAHLADPLRENLTGGGSVGAAAPLVVNINAVDAASVRRLFMDHGPALADAIKAQARGFRT